MKKFLLSLVALLGVMNANAQVTETDRTEYPDVIYAQPLTVLKGTESATLTINIKSHTNFQSIQFDLVLPDGASIVDLDGIEKSRKSYSPGHQGSEVYEYNDGGTIIGTATCDYGFKAGDDVFSYITINVANLEAGEYPIIVKNATISGFITAEGVSTAEKDALIADEITTILTVVDGVVLDENSTTAPKAAENTKVTVKRTIKANSWSTICLPFATTATQLSEAFSEACGEEVQVELADFKGYSATYDDDDFVTSIAVKFESISELAANHPCIIKVSSDISEFTVNNVNVAPAEDLEINVGTSSRKYKIICGNYIAGTNIGSATEPALFLSGNKFWYATGATKLKAFRAYFSFYELLKEVDPEAGVKMFIDNVPTNISDIDFVTAPEGVFTIDGKKMNNDVTKLPKGVYIIDGKKVAIK